MSYKPDADVFYPWYRYEFLEWLSLPSVVEFKRHKVCLFHFDPVSESNHEEYLKELREYIRIDLFGFEGMADQARHDRTLDQGMADQARHDRTLDQGMADQVRHDRGQKDFYRRYKFVIAFENAIEEDFVTDKFFDPLLAGSVPVYMGAPNIEEFTPGENCFVDVRKFESPKSLAQFINDCCENDELYFQFFEWKNKPLRESFVKKMEAQKKHPLAQLCNKIDLVKHVG